MTATAQDAVGNTTARQVDVQVVIPATPAQIVLGLAILLLLCAIPVIGAVVAWTQRDRIRAWRAKRGDLARQRAAERGARAAEAASQRQLVAHRKDYAAYQAADATWRSGHDHLASLVTTARTLQPSANTQSLLQLKRGETCYGTFAATMVEQRTRQGATSLVDVAAGRAVVTNQRVTFVSDKNRDWTYTKVQQVATDADLTLLAVSNRKQTSGLRVSRSALDQFRLRLRLDLALADQHGGRDAVVARRLDALGAHDRNRPVPPMPPVRPRPQPQTVKSPEGQRCAEATKWAGATSAASRCVEPRPLAGCVCFRTGGRAMLLSNQEAWRVAGQVSRSRPMMASPPGARSSN